MKSFLVVFFFGALAVISADAGCGDCEIADIKVTPLDDGTIMELNIPAKEAELGDDCIVHTSKNMFLNIKEKGLKFQKVHVKCSKGLMRANETVEGCENYEKLKENEDVSPALCLFGFDKMNCEEPSGFYEGGSSISVKKWENHINGATAQGKSGCESVKFFFSDADGKERTAEFKAEVEIKCKLGLGK